LRDPTFWVSAADKRIHHTGRQSRRIRLAPRSGIRCDDKEVVGSRKWALPDLRSGQSYCGLMWGRTIRHRHRRCRRTRANGDVRLRFNAVASRQATVVCDPHVWTGGASQEGFGVLASWSCTNVSGLSVERLMCSWPSWIWARIRS